jgi:hypothetical protein
LPPAPGDLLPLFGLDAAVTEIDPGADTGPEPPPLPAKADGPTFPPTLAERRHVALSDTHAAWVERGQTEQAKPRLVVWKLGTLELPKPFTLPYLPVDELGDPRDLALGANHLFYVDDRYGDPDVFAVRLSDGKSMPIAVFPGVQDAPRALGSSVVWQDCRKCALDGDPAGREIYRREMDQTEPVALSDDQVEDRAPALGTLTDGSVAAIWIRGDSTLVLKGHQVDKTFDASHAGRIGHAVLTVGIIAYRPEPAIINPDTMMPVPVSLLLSVTGLPIPAPIAGEANLLGKTPAVVVAAGGRIAWLTHDRQDQSQRIEMLKVAAGETPGPVDPIETSGATGIAISAGWLALTAPQPDTGGLDNVWLYGLE